MLPATPPVDDGEQDADKTMEAPTLGMQQQCSQSEQPSLEDFLSYYGLEKLLPVLQVTNWVGTLCGHVITCYNV